jgi:ribosome-associated toxin RatA of RatAB toxin-antitoxin module
MGVDRAERTIEIVGPPAACFDAVVDFESYPAWQSLVKECLVHERDEQGRGTVVETLVEARIRTFRYVLRYAYDEPSHVTWDLVEGDVRSLEGEYVFEPSGGKTIATYRLAVDLGRFGRMVPGEMKRKATEHLMSTTITELKARVESDE